MADSDFDIRRVRNWTWPNIEVYLRKKTVAVGVELWYGVSGRSYTSYSSVTYNKFAEI